MKHCAAAAVQGSSAPFPSALHLPTWLFVSSQRGHVGGAANLDLPFASSGSGGGLPGVCPHAMAAAVATSAVGTDRPSCQCRSAVTCTMYVS